MSIFDRLANARDAFWGYNKPQTIVIPAPTPYYWDQPMPQRPNQNLPDYKADFDQLQQQINKLQTENEDLRNAYQQSPKAADIETLRQQMLGTTEALTKGISTTADLAKKNKCETDECIVDLQKQIDELTGKVHNLEKHGKDVDKRLDNHWTRIMENEKSLVDAEKQIEANKKANEDTLALLKAKGVL